MTMQNLVRGAALGLAALVGFASVTPGLAADAALVEAAKKEGSLTWYTSLVATTMARPMAAAFEAAYPGITVNVVNGTDGDLYLKMMAEAGAGDIQADVGHGTSTTYDIFEAGLIENYVPASVSSLPKDLLREDGAWTPMTRYVFSPAVNTSLVAEADYPKTLQDLLDPRWKGELVWPLLKTQNGPPGFIGVVLHELGETAGMEYLHKLAEQNIVNKPGNPRVVLDSVISGEHPLMLGAGTHHVELTKANGAPVEWLTFYPSIVSMDVVYVMKGAKHPNAAKLFVEYVTSEAGQKVLADGGYIPANPNTPSKKPELIPEVGKFPVYTMTYQDVRSNLPKWISLYEQIFLK